MKLHTLSPAKGGKVRQNKRVGRGQGSGRGGTSTRGHKGAKSRSGYSQKFGFEGGQMPLQRRVPKFGFKAPFRVEYSVINLDDIQKIATEKGITTFAFETFVELGVVAKNGIVKVLGNGELTATVEISANAFSASAKEAIEKAGGKAITL
ncbi:MULTISPECIES: 50S ribosomal protein L15 [Flammeovirga]|jgi:large subunit ribosomal protein L15|uniref:Large ribosomal subunit protein uL15 n=1 Tax=Flammeovirga aprica JL-4 TaxID=694437 RepID=A0A7X9P0J2_9BACT|nr:MULTISPECIES: 50S ribosomal protein L15 [Flammeovirga]KXX68284.1 50S ribosomal protein L15 [Flammeovirga sp. SJP92]NME66419.1 50S ribosomal protein L15 [Flammeovirga aprica JL-4]